MKRIGAYILNALTVLSLLLFVATAVLWVRSYHPGEILYRVSENGWRDDDHFVMHLSGGQSVRGQIGWVSRRLETNAVRKRSGLNRSIEREPLLSIGWHQDARGDLVPDSFRPAWSGAFGFYVRHTHDERQIDFGLKSDRSDPELPRHIYDERYVLIPHWFLLLACAVLPLRALGRAVRRFKHKLGHCRRCGYDLRATPDRCPECGAIPPAATMTR